MTIVIGGAAGGYVAGIRSAQLARRTAVVARDIRIDWDALASRRAKVSENLSNGVSFPWGRNGATLIEGERSLTPDGQRRCRGGRP